MFHPEERLLFAQVVQRCGNLQGPAHDLMILSLILVSTKICSAQSFSCDPVLCCCCVTWTSPWAIIMRFAHVSHSGRSIHINQVTVLNHIPVVAFTCITSLSFYPLDAKGTGRSPFCTSRISKPAISRTTIAFVSTSLMPVRLRCQLLLVMLCLDHLHVGSPGIITMCRCRTSRVPTCREYGRCNCVTLVVVSFRDRQVSHSMQGDRQVLHSMQGGASIGMHTVVESCQGFPVRLYSMLCCLNSRCRLPWRRDRLP